MGSEGIVANAACAELNLFSFSRLRRLSEMLCSYQTSPRRLHSRIFRILRLHLALTSFDASQLAFGRCERARRNLDLDTLPAVSYMSVSLHADLFDTPPSAHRRDFLDTLKLVAPNSDDVVVTRRPRSLIEAAADWNLAARRYCRQASRDRLNDHHSLLLSPSPFLLLNSSRAHSHLPPSTFNA